MGRHLEGKEGDSGEAELQTASPPPSQGRCPGARKVRGQKEVERSREKPCSRAQHGAPWGDTSW